MRGSHWHLPSGASPHVAAPELEPRSVRLLSLPCTASACAWPCLPSCPFPAAVRPRAWPHFTDGELRLGSRWTHHLVQSLELNFPDPHLLPGPPHLDPSSPLAQPGTHRASYHSQGHRSTPCTPSLSRICCRCLGSPHR